MKNKQEYIETSKGAEVIKESAENGTFSLKVLLKGWKYIVIAAVLCALLGVVYSLCIRKTVYTAQKEMLFAINIVEEQDGKKYISPTANLSISEKYLPTIKKHIASPKYVNKANEIYLANGGDEGRVSSGSIKLDTKSDTLVVILSYVDASAKAASEKLEAVIISANNFLPDYNLASDVELKTLQNDVTVKADNGLIKYSAIGLIGGAAIGALVFFAVRFFDHTVKNKDEIEEITDTYLVARISDRK